MVLSVRLGLYTISERVIFYLCLSSLFRLKRDACSCNSCFERRETDRFAQWTFYIDEKKQRFKSFKVPELRSNMILCIYAFEGKYYIGTYGGGIYILNPSTLTLSDFETADLKSTPFLKGHVFCIKSDDEGSLWMATSMGLYCYRDGKQIRHYTTENSKLPGENVYDICLIPLVKDGFVQRTVYAFGIHQPIV